MERVIEVTDLYKSYGSNQVVKGISFHVNKGEIFGIVGPNGAGKTTTMTMTMGLKASDKGTIRVLGMDPIAQGVALRERIGIQLQEADLPDRLKVWEALDLFSSFYQKVVNWEDLLKEWGLTEKRNTPFGKLSGGQKQRVFIALALINDPEIVFLDELTTGLDPQARRQTWELVRAIRDRGKTVIQVTHFMDEAEELCDRVGIIDHGQMIALDTPKALIAGMKGENSVTFTAPEDFNATVLEAIQGVSRVTQKGKEVVVYGPSGLLAPIAAKLAEHNLSPSDLQAKRVTLEDVFLALTGKEIRKD